MSAVIIPHVVPVKRAMPGLALEDRKRLAEAMASSSSIPEAAAAFGCSKEKLVALATREGFQSLLSDLRHPLLIAMQDPARREELLQCIREALPVQQIGKRFGCSRSAVWGYFYRTGLDHPYMEARKKYQSTRRVIPADSTLDVRSQEKLCIAAMLASRGVEMSAAPQYTHGRLDGFRLRANGQEVRILRTRSAVVERSYYRVNPTITDAWYLVITERHHLIVYAPPHDGRVRYIPIVNPVLILDSREPPWGLWKPRDWITPEELGLGKRKRRKKANAS